MVVRFRSCSAHRLFAYSVLLRGLCVCVWVLLSSEAVWRNVVDNRSDSTGRVRMYEVCTEGVPLELTRRLSCTFMKSNLQTENRSQRRVMCGERGARKVASEDLTAQWGEPNPTKSQILLVINLKWEPGPRLGLHVSNSMQRLCNLQMTMSSICLHGKTPVF